MTYMNKQDKKIYEAIRHAREVQDFIWGNDSFMNDAEFDMKSWVAVFQKRVDKIAVINTNHSSYKIELRKRLLQQAALSIQAMELLDKI